MLEAIDRNINNVFSLLVAGTYIHYNQNSVADIRELKKHIDKQGNRLQWFPSYGPVHGRISSILSAVNFDISKYRFYNVNYKPVRQPLQGRRYFILDLWFVYCPPCIEQHRQIKELYAELQKNSIEIIGISRDDDHNLWSSTLTSIITHGQTCANIPAKRSQKI